MNFENIVKFMEKSEACLNYELINAPFVPNTFSLWRDVVYENVDPNQWFEFVKQIDKQLFQKYLEKVREAYARKLTYQDLKLNVRYDLDDKKLKSIFENNLKKQVDTLTVHLSYYQAQVEYAYDLLRRIHTYKFVDYNVEQIQTQQKDQTLYQKYLDKIMRGFISNVQDIATEKIKEYCATGLIKSNSFLESGKSFFKQFLFNGGVTVAKLSNINLGLFIGGIIAEQIVSKVALSMMVQRVSSKLDYLQLELDQMTNELTYINSDLDHLIYRAAEEFPRNFEQNQTFIQAFVQKNYKVNLGSDIIYCSETNTIIQKSIEEDCVILNEVEYNLPLQEENDEDACVIKFSSSNISDNINKQHFDSIF
ncbi:unnamed protein product [Paramecium primaurelia]|uniref:Uncharacterized protein n=1 Tax=Paramecium primaurelia TaxID=5886 RepID=A0A8S1MWF2_PARPR|nr:unnamed protein product [Paramecium primaurelia]